MNTLVAKEKEDFDNISKIIEGGINFYHSLAMRTAKDMGTPKMNLIHAAFGVSGETDELSAPFLTGYSLFDNMENIVEEIGDIYWFVILFIDTLNKIKLTSDDIDFSFYDMLIDASDMDALPNVSAVDRIIMLNTRAGDITDLVKKHTVYGKDLDRNQLANKLVELLQVLGAILEFINKPLTYVLSMNVLKLMTRYPDKYSGYHAVTRADKQE